MLILSDAKRFVLELEMRGLDNGFSALVDTSFVYDLLDTSVSPMNLVAGTVCTSVEY
jgi:hypothetical protein